jgi:large subunit ribosomal protein L32
MANPKRKLSRSKRDMRRANWLNSVGTSNIIDCDNCGEKMIAHRACPSCGFYRGKSVVNPQSS